jgi:hopanoid biosynthesis associated RND transporter like protein HpnN
MSIPGLLAGLVERSQRNAVLVLVAGALLAGLGLFTAAKRLGVTTDTNQLFSEQLPWRHRSIEINRDFPQLTNILVAVIDARIPEEADATAAALAKALAGDTVHFVNVARPDASPFLEKEGLLFLDDKTLNMTLDGIIQAQPFLGQLVADPSARGLFETLSLIGTGVSNGQASGLDSFHPALNAFHETMAGAVAGHAQPLSWIKLLGGQLADLGGQYKFVLFRTNLEFGSLKPGGAATQAIRDAADRLEFIKSGEAHMRITGPVALSDDEFETVAKGTVKGLFISVVLITLWLFLAVRTWRLIVPILLTLGLGLVLTLFFAAVAVGTLNLVSVGFGVLFIGIAVDFAIQFGVRYREIRHQDPDPASALKETGRRVGRQILVASAATAAGFLSFVPTDFNGVAELGLIAGAGMIIAFICTMTFLPAAITVFRPHGESAELGFKGGVYLDALMRRRRWPIVLGFVVTAAAGLALLPRLYFDSNPLHVKNQSTESIKTLYDLMASPVANPFTIDFETPNAVDAATQSAILEKLPLVASTLSINSFIPQNQAQKLAAIADTSSLLGPTLVRHDTTTPITPDALRAAAKKALASIELGLPKLPPDHPLVAIAADLRNLSVASDSVLMDANYALTRFLSEQLDQLRNVLDPQTVTLDNIPPDIKDQWVLPDGRARVQVVPVANARDSASIEKFVAEVSAVEPNASGAAVTIQAASATIIHAFRSAALTALIAIAVILLFILRRIQDVALVLAPLLLSALLTVIVAVTLPLPLNFANIIALPLLLGVGVSFNIYFVMNWRAGQTAVLGSATARAILFSALTTGTAFASLALSAHPGTASMGVLLLISLACTLMASLAFIPALLATVPRPS